MVVYVSKMKNFHVILLFLSIFKNCVSLEHLWHSYQYDPIHKSREELVVTNVVVNDHYKFDHVVEKWRSLCSEEICLLAGLMEMGIAITSFKMNENNNSFIENSYKIDLDTKPNDIALFHYWNSISENSEAVVVVATEKPQLLWYKINEQNQTLFWTWSLDKNVSHINTFMKDYDHHLLLISQHLSHTTADLYMFEPNNSPNFWLRQTFSLSDFATSSAFVPTGLDSFLAIPQKSLDMVQIFKFDRDHFMPFKNISSGGVDDVVSFKIGHKSFLTLNGLSAGIYGFTGQEIRRENITASHTDGINYWLPIRLSVYGDDIVLLAQRILEHGLHKSFVMEVITHNGDKFEEHEDIPCFYYGETGLGLSCLPDEEAQRGIKGSASIFLDGAVGLLIPRKNRSSEYFIVHTALHKVPNPLKKQVEEFVAMKQQIDGLISIQEKRYNEIYARSRESFDYVAIKTQLEEIEKDIQAMKQSASTQEGSSHYDTAIFNGVVTITSSGVFDEVFVENINSESADALLADIVLKNNVSQVDGTKAFKNLGVENLKFSQINNVNSSELLYIDDNVTINGDWFLTRPLTVSGNLDAAGVNGLIFEDEIIGSKSNANNLVFENLIISVDASVDRVNDHYLPVMTASDKVIFEKLTYKELFIPRDIKAVNINGEPFHEFLTKLCLKSIRNYVPGAINVNGDITILGDAETEYLNDLEFPRQYVFVENSFPNITGTKIFSNSLTVIALMCDGTVDDVLPSEVMTLRTDQNISGVTTFHNLKITESLHVEGKIVGEHASKFLPNPTLLETNFVKSKVHFKNLEVDGSIIVTDNFNGINLESQLSDIVYASEEKPVIEAMKQFPEGFTVRSNLAISSNSVNNISLDSVVTKDTEQSLDLPSIKGVVNFGNVDVEGLYNSVDVEQLNEQLIKLSGEQYISSTLIFEEVSVNKLEVIESIKKVGMSLSTTKDGENSTVEIQNMTVEGNVYGDIDGFDLQNFDNSRMSLSKDQSVEADFFIDKSFVENMSSEDLNEFKYEFWERKLIAKLINGDLEIENFHVNKSLELEKINNETVMNLGGSFWNHDIKKHNLTKLMFNDDVYFDNVNIEKLSGVPFHMFVGNMVFKNETDIKLKGRKTFVNGLRVKKLIETEKLNDILLFNVLRRYEKQEVVGPLTVHGNVLFQDNVTVFENIADVPVNMITDNFQDKGHHFQIKGDVIFTRLAHVHNLQIHGHVEGRKVQEVVDGIVYKDEDFKLTGLITFDNTINIEKNIRVNGKINNIDLPGFVSDMIMITKDTAIESPVRFEEAVFVENQIVLHEGLKTGDLNGIDLKSWMDDAVFINKGYLHGSYLFEDARVVDTLQTEHINNIDMKTLIPLRTQQNLSNLTFNEISLFKDVDVGNSTNFRNLSQEFENSVLTNSDQDIHSDVDFVGNVFIESDFALLGTLNNMETKRIVTTNTDQELSATYNFKSKINLEKDLLVEGLVNGVDIDKWIKEGVRTSSDYPQNISDNWVVNHDLIFGEDCTGNGLINGIDFQQFANEIEEKRNVKYQVEKDLIDDYKNICRDLTYMYDKLKRQIYKFDYLENLQTLNFRYKIEFVHSYQYQNRAYLIINERKNCESYLFMLDSRFRYVRSIHFGHIDQIISVYYNDLMYFVVRNQPFYSTCKVQGTNLWQLTDNGFENQANIEEQDLLQESLQPGTFYGINGHTVTEFKIFPDLGTIVRKYRIWKVKEDNMAFVPRGLATGLAMHTGKKLIKLNRDNSKPDDFSFDVEKIIIGNYSEEINTYLPGRKDSDLVVMKVGIKSSKRNLLAVASHEETRVKGNLDFIKIYEDAISGKIFHKVATYKPSSLISLDFGNGETLLAFMEDESALHVYEYKGIEGFQEKLSAKLKGSKLVAMSLQGNKNKRKILGVIDRNKISFMEVVMSGNQVEENLHCSL